MVPLPLSPGAAIVFDAWAVAFIDFRKQSPLSAESKTGERRTSTKSKPKPKESKK